MRILFEQTGGFMGRTFSLDLDFKDLPDEEAGRLRYMLEQAGFYSLPANTPPGPARDDFHYRLTVEDESSQHTIRTTDSSAPPALLNLIQELSRRARAQHNK